MKILPVLLVSLAFGVMGCTQPVLKNIDVKEAQSLLASNKDHKLQVIDLRTPGEIASTGSLPGAEFIDFTANSFESKLKQLDKNRPVLLYCASGGRSGQTAAMLHKQKYRMVYEMSPGMNGWLAAGFPTSK